MALPRFPVDHTVFPCNYTMTVSRIFLIQVNIQMLLLFRSREWDWPRDHDSPDKMPDRSDSPDVTIQEPCIDLGHIHRDPVPFYSFPSCWNGLDSS